MLFKYNCKDYNFNNPPPVGLPFIIDTSNPLTKGLKLFPSVFESSTGDVGLYNVANKQFGVLRQAVSGATGAPRKIYTRGRGWNINMPAANGAIFSCNFGNLGNLKGKPCTISIWFLYENASYRGPFFACARADNSKNGLEFGMSYVNSRVVYTRSTNRAENEGFATLIGTSTTNLGNPNHAYSTPTNTWINFTITDTGAGTAGSVTLYVNAVYEGTGRGSLTDFGPSTELDYANWYMGYALGSYYLGGANPSNFSGLLGQLAVWDRILPVSEITSYYNNPYQVLAIDYNIADIYMSTAEQATAWMQSMNINNGMPFGGVML